MASLAAGYFPQVRYLANQKLLWNPIWKRTLITRPEERVRLQWVELLLSSGWSRNRVSTELPVKTPVSKNKLRADLLCYDDALNPLLLIECKAPKVKLKQLTAEQAGRYNQQIGAPYIMLTNGQQDLWYQTKIDHEDQTKSITYEDVLTPQPVTSDTKYWSKRGFIAQDLSSDQQIDTFKMWLDQWHQDPDQWTYLSFDHLPDHIPAHHYYRLYNTSQTSTWALSLIRGYDNSTNLIAALNQEGSLKGMLLITWSDNINQGLHPTQCQLYLPTGSIGVSDSDHLHLISQWQQAESMDAFAEALDLLFQTYQITG